MDKEALDNIEAIMKKAIQNRVFPGGVVLVARKNGIVYEKAFGSAYRYKDSKKTPAENPIPADPGTIYDIASITKLFTATAVMQLAEKNKISLDDPVARYVPLFGVNGKEKITIRQLLSHTGGLPATLPLYQLPGDREGKLALLFTSKPVAQPGSKMIYSDIGYIVLGELVRQVSGMPLSVYLETSIFKPLGMNATMYKPPSILRKSIAATEDQSAESRGMVWGEVHDENAWALGGMSGHAGLFSTAEDLAKFGLAFMNQGEWNGKRILNPESVEEMTKLQTGNIPDAFRGLGWELRQDWYMGPFAAKETFGHTGFTGTSLFVDPKRDVMVILLTNRVHPTRTGPNVSEVRKQIAEAVFSSILDK